ncbi:formimidoylglutamate deiminase [Labrenzia sp. CE80]|uniref:formimidoylglutamate deiminase n=1 Tax=Labrenzia sp. CE80 TaxID=1788986 RepID=UPI00129AB98F|nr:formimidoylglutamate deiminase [Labrenzia sp. CE80]
MQKLWAQRALTLDGWKNGVSIEIGPNGKIERVDSDTEPNGEIYGCVLPAPANAHSHAFQRAMAGLTEQRGADPTDSFWSWRRLMFRFLERITPEQVQAIAAFVQMEMLEAGYATNVEFHYLHHGPGGEPYAQLAEMAMRITEAAKETGIGLTLLPVFYQYGGLDGRPLSAGQNRFGNDIERFMKLAEDSTGLVNDGPRDWVSGIAPHSLRAVAPRDLKQIASLFRDGPIHMHLAEQIPEVEETLSSLGMRPVEWTLDHIEPDARWHFIHLTQMLPHETERLAHTGATAVLCPITESSLGDGIFDGLGWFEAGGRVAIGSDSNIRISLSEELRTLDYSQRLRDHSRAALATAEQSTGRRLFEAILNGGAASADRSTGALEAGLWADMLALDTSHVDLADLQGDMLIDSFSFAGDDNLVTDVWSAGRHMVQRGQHVRRDQILAQYRSAVQELRAAY